MTETQSAGMAAPGRVNSSATGAVRESDLALTPLYAETANSLGARPATTGTPRIRTDAPATANSRWPVGSAAHRIPLAFLPAGTAAGCSTRTANLRRDAMMGILTTETAARRLAESSQEPRVQASQVVARSPCVEMVVNPKRARVAMPGTRTDSFTATERVVPRPAPENRRVAAAMASRVRVPRRAATETSTTERSATTGT